LQPFFVEKSYCTNRTYVLLLNTEQMFLKQNLKPKIEGGNENKDETEAEGGNET